MINSDDDDSNFESEKRKKSGTFINRSVPRACFLRENGARSEGLKVAKELEWAAEDIFVQKVHKEHRFQLPENARSTFLMVFSPDGKIVASTHGNHSIYVTDVRTCKTIRTLKGHPRTPWCIAFHPSSNQILASGCLGGEVRVWDLHGGSEIWTSDCHTVIASLAFHPIERVLVIATYNELYFWDWSEKTPFAKCRTGHEKEKIRYVAFDHLGQKLITGIANVSPLQSQWDRITAPTQNDPEDCLRRMLSERNRERPPPRENFNLSSSVGESPPFPSLSDRLASWNPSVRRQALAEMRLPYRYNFRSHNVRRLRSTSSSSLLHNALRPCVNWRPPSLRPEQSSLISSNQRDRDRYSIENYLLGNRDFTLNDFISVVRSQSENGASQSTSDGDHNYSESEQNGSIEYWRVLLDFFFDEADQESGFNRSNPNRNETENESLFTDHDYSTSRERFARSRHTWWSRNIDEEQPGDATESASGARQTSGSLLRSMARWTRAPLPPLSTLEHSSSAPDSSANEVTTPGETHSAFFVRSMSRLQTQLRRLQKTLSYLESQNAAIRDRSFRCESGGGSSIRTTSSLQGLSPLALQPLSERQVHSSSGVWSSSGVLNVEAARVDSNRLLQFVSYRRAVSIVTRQRMQILIQRMHRRLAEIQAAAQGSSSQTQERSSATNSFPSSNSVLWGPSSSAETQEEPSLRDRMRTESWPLRQSMPFNSLSAESANRDSSPNRHPPYGYASQLRARKTSMESTRRRYLEERIKTLRQLADVNRSSAANPPSASSQEPRAFQNYTPKPSCSRTNEASEAETPPSLLAKGKQLSYFEKLKAKFAQLSRQIKEQCAASASDFSSEYWKAPGASTSHSSDDVSSSSDRMNASDMVNSESTSETMRNEANSVNDTGNSDVSNNLTDRLNSIVTSLSRVSNALGRSASCEFGADSINSSDKIAQTDKKNKSDKIDIGETSNGATRGSKRRKSCGEEDSGASFPFRQNNLSENGCGASSSSSSDNQVDNNVAPLNRSISSFLGSLRRSSSLTSSSTSSSNESWQGPISEVGNAPSSSAKQDQREPAVSPSPERNRVTLKRKFDASLSDSQSAPTAGASSSVSSPRSDLVTARPSLRPGSFLSPSSSTTSCSDSSSTSSSDSDNQDSTGNLLDNILSSVRQNTELIGALQQRQHQIRRSRNRAFYCPLSNPATPSSASLQSTLSDSSRYMESLFGGPSRNVRRRSGEEIGTQLRTLIYLFQEYLEHLTLGTAGTRPATITILQDILRLVFYFADFSVALSEQEAEEGESSQRPRRSPEEIQERERLLFSELNRFQRDLVEAPVSERHSSELNGENPFRDTSGPFMRFSRMNTREPNRESSNDQSRGTATLIDTSPGDRRVRRERIDLARERQLIKIRMEELRERTERLRRFANERRNRRQSLRERLDENRLRRERALRELRELGEQIRESRAQDFLRRRQLLRETRELGRQNHQIIRSLIEAADRANESSAVSSSELFRTSEGSGANQDSSSNNVSPSPPRYFELSDPQLRQFNNSRPLSLSSQQREQRSSFSSHSSPSNALQRPVLCVPLVRVNDQPVNLPAESNEPSQRNRTRSPPLFFAPDSMVDDRGSLGPEDSRRFLGRSFQSSSIDDPNLFPDTPRSYFTRRSIPNELRISLHHRIQAWDFSRWTPCSALDIKDPHKNLVVADCKIYNDASVDISSDSSLLVTLLPSSRFGFTCMLGIYSLEWETLGQRLYVVSFEQNAVSVSLSPTCRYLVVGLSARRRTSLGTENDTVAQILRLDGAVPSQLSASPQKGRLIEVRELELYREMSSMSLNCIRWAPTPGQGIVCGTNTGQLTFLR